MRQYLLALLLAPAVACAQPTLDLDAQVSSKVPNDTMTIVLAVEATGTDLATMNAQTLRSLNALIKEAKLLAGTQAEAVHTRLGTVHTMPLYGPSGRKPGWQVRGEVVLASAQMALLGDIAGALAQRAQVANVHFSLSPDRRRAEERRLLAEAATAFLARAADTARAFGFKGVQVEKLTLGATSPGSPPVVRVKTMAADAAIPAEGGDTEVTVTVSGTVTLKP